jgi:hypothetical protein
MICSSCGRRFAKSQGPGIICDGCWARSRSARPLNQKGRRRHPIEVAPHCDPRPAGRAPTVVFVLLDANALDRSSDEPEVA